MLRGDRVIIALIVVLGVMTFGGTMIDPLYPPFVKDVVRAGAVGFGGLLTAQAIGGIIGGLILGHVGPALSPARVLAWGNILVGMLLLVQFNLPLLPVALSMAFLIGPEQVAAGAALQTLLQSSVADAYKGRVFGALGTTGALLSALGGGLAGPLGETLGVVPTLNIAAVLTLLAGLLAHLLLPHRPGGRGTAGHATEGKGRIW